MPDGNLAEALRAGVGLRLDVHAGLAHRHQGIDGLDHEEEHGGADRDEGDECVDELSVVEFAAVDRELQRGEIMATEDRCDQGCEEIAHKGCHHGSEGGSDHDPHSEVDHVASQQERLELLGHAIPS